MKCRTLSSCFLLLTCTLTTPLSSAAPLKEEPLKINFSTFFKVLFGFSQENSSQQSETMLVIGPGFGRTGTSSFIAAMNRIGLKSYHMSAVSKTPGHLDLWLEYTQALEEGNPAKKADEIMHSMSTNGFNATSSMPACYLYKDLMERYPNARVVLTVRGDGDGLAWAKSVKSSIGLLRKAVERVPFRWVPKVQRFKDLMDWIFAQRGVYFDENLELSDTDLADAYNGWVAEVKATVPEEKLLVFAAQNGWKPLCDFLSPLNSDIEENCQEIFVSGEPYPRINEKTQVRRLIGVLTAVSTAFEYGPYVLAIWAVLWVAKRSQKEKSKKE